jgi:hypothetical protein
VTPDRHQPRRRADLGTRAKTEPLTRRPLRELRLLRRENRDLPDIDRPKTRGDCLLGPRPCPFVGCRHHLYLDVLPTGSMKFNFPDLEPDELTETCALDVADRGGATLEDAGALLNVTRERVRQMTMAVCEKLRRRGVFPW